MVPGHSIFLLIPCWFFYWHLSVSVFGTGMLFIGDTRTINLAGSFLAYSLFIISFLKPFSQERPANGCLIQNWLTWKEKSPAFFGCLFAV